MQGLFFLENNLFVLRQGQISASLKTAISWGRSWWMSHIAEDLTITIKLLSHFSFILQCLALVTARLNSLCPNRKHTGREPKRVKNKPRVALCGEKKRELTSYSQRHHGESSRVAPEIVRNVEPHHFGAAFNQRHALSTSLMPTAQRPWFKERLEMLCAIF